VLGRIQGLDRVQMNHIPYKGGSVAVGELVGGQVEAYFGNLTCFAT